MSLNDFKHLNTKIRGFNDFFRFLMVTRILEVNCAKITKIDKDSLCMNFFDFSGFRSPTYKCIKFGYHF